MRRFQVIVADPPWSFSDSLTMSSVKRGAKSHYSVAGTHDDKNTLTVNELCDLPIRECAQDDALLVLWVPGSMIEDGLRVMKAWGFEQKQVQVWVKTKKKPLSNLFKILKKYIKAQLIGKKLDFLISSFNLNDVLDFNMGRIFRQTHEIALIGTRGKINSKLKNKSQRSVFFHCNMRHSQKPEILQDMLGKMFTGRKLELFARRQRRGWVCLGNEIDGMDIRDALGRLRNM